MNVELVRHATQNLIPMQKGRIGAKFGNRAKVAITNLDTEINYIKT